VRLLQERGVYAPTQDRVAPTPEEPARAEPAPEELTPAP
jgi:hypothetical protein